MYHLHCLGHQSPVNLLQGSTPPRLQTEENSHSKIRILSLEPVSILWRKSLPPQSSRVSVTVRSSRQAQNPLVKEDENIGGGGVELTEYRDSWLDLLFINGCRKTFGRVANWQSPRSWEEGYLGMVEVSHAMMRGRSAAQQQNAVLKGFPRVPDWFRKLFPYSDWGAELNARITPLFFEWLVGPCEASANWILFTRYIRQSMERLPARPTQVTKAHGISAGRRGASWGQGFTKGRSNKKMSVLGNKWLYRDVHQFVQSPNAVLLHN